MKHFLKFRPILFACASLARAETPSRWELLPEVCVGSKGVLLSSVIPVAQRADLPEVVLAPAPDVGKFSVYSRAQIAESALKAAPELAVTNWSGAKAVRVTRRTRHVGEAELKSLFGKALQTEYSREVGELEISLQRPSNDFVVCDEPVTLRILDTPGTGLASTLSLRFELENGRETFGPWQAVVQARLWRDVLVVNSPLARGQSLPDADLVVERRDFLQCRDAVAVARREDAAWEISQNASPGSVLTGRLIRRRPVIQRGRVVAATVVDGPLSITVKVEALEDGLTGQTVRVRNLQSKREFQGKVQNDQTVLVTL
jgi:flagella basal body P-ring formation protein FlgA